MSRLLLFGVTNPAAEHFPDFLELFLELQVMFLR
jgi:hypothetical protein